MCWWSSTYPHIFFETWAEHVFNWRVSQTSWEIVLRVPRKNIFHLHQSLWVSTWHLTIKRNVEQILFGREAIRRILSRYLCKLWSKFNCFCICTSITGSMLKSGTISTTGCIRRSYQTLLAGRKCVRRSSEKTKLWMCYCMGLIELNTYCHAKFIHAGVTLNCWQNDWWCFFFTLLWWSLCPRLDPNGTLLEEECYFAQ